VPVSVSLPTESVIVDHAVLLLVILFFNVIVDINIGVLAYLTQFINTFKMSKCRTYANVLIKISSLPK
jgi:hypothetical protein